MSKTSLRVVAGLVASLISSGAFAQTTPVVNYGYNTASQLTGTTEPNGQTHAFEYNEFGELSRHRLANPVGTGTSGQVDYGYNGRGQIASVTMPTAAAKQFTFANSVGILKTTGAGTTCADGSCGQLDAGAFDTRGNRLFHVSESGAKTCFVYDQSRNLLLQSVEGLAATDDCAAARHHAWPA